MGFCAFNCCGVLIIGVCCVCAKLRDQQERERQEEANNEQNIRRSAARDLVEKQPLTGARQDDTTVDEQLDKTVDDLEIADNSLDMSVDIDQAENSIEAVEVEM